MKTPLMTNFPLKNTHLDLTLAAWFQSLTAPEAGDIVVMTQVWK